MIVTTKVIKKGACLFKVDTRTGRISGRRHTFEQDSKYTVRVSNKTYATMLIVKNGPDKGAYVLSA